MSRIKIIVSAVLIAVVMFGGEYVAVSHHHRNQIAAQNAAVAANQREMLQQWQVKLQAWNDQAAREKQVEMASSQTAQISQASSDLPDTGATQNVALLLAIIVVIAVTLTYTLAAALIA